MAKPHGLVKSTRVPTDVAAKIATAARQEGLTESAYIARVLTSAVSSSTAAQREHDLWMIIRSLNQQVEWGKKAEAHLGKMIELVDELLNNKPGSGQ